MHYDNDFKLVNDGLVFTILQCQNDKMSKLKCDLETIEFMHMNDLYYVFH